MRALSVCQAAQSSRRWSGPASRCPLNPPPLAAGLSGETNLARTWVMDTHITPKSSCADLIRASTLSSAPRRRGWPGRARPRRSYSADFLSCSAIKSPDSLRLRGRRVGRIISCGIAMIPAGKQSCRCIGTTCHPAHFARYCGKPASAGLSFSTCSEQKARVGQALSSSSSAFASLRSGVSKPSVNQP